MKKTYQHTERIFEKLTGFITKFLGNSITFLAAFALVIFWWSNDEFRSRGIHQTVGDIIFGTTFLSLFIIQKSFNIYSAHIHLKMNELISSHEPANNAVMDMSKKTEKEIVELYKEYIEDHEQLDKELDEALKDINIENKI